MVRKVIIIILIFAFLADTIFLGLTCADVWTQTSQSDFDAGTKTNVDTISNPGNVILSQVWTKSLANPVVDIGPPGSWEEYCVWAPSVIYNGTTYQMWYTGDDIPTFGRIGYATSLDGIIWSKYGGNPVLDLGLPGSWEDTNIDRVSVLFIGTTYHMWYSGDNGTNVRIGYATSPDGITWVKHPSNPVLDLGTPGSWDDIHVWAPTVLYDGLTYHMWYTGCGDIPKRIGYATSPDGIIWTKHPGNPVLDLGSPGSWDDTHVRVPTVTYDGRIYHMWYNGCEGPNNMIGYATSMDGIIWIKDPANPVLNLGPPGSWDDVWVRDPCVLYDGGTYRMWYTGFDGSTRRIGHAIMSYQLSGNLISSVFDSGASGTTWNYINWTEYLPPGTDITLATRSGDTFIPDASWSPWSPEMGDETGSAITSPKSRYIQYRASLSTPSQYITPILREVNINYSLYTPPPPNQPPIADAGANHVVYEGDVVQFNGSNSYDPDGTIVSFEWDFNASDGLCWETGSPPDAIGQTPVYTYLDEGVYIVTLNVTDNNSSSDLDNCSITVLKVPELNINTSLDGRDVILYWDAPSTYGIDHYLIYRSTSQTSFDFNKVWVNTLLDNETGEPGPIPLRTIWNDTNAAYPDNETNYEEQYYYTLRVVNILGKTSRTTRTVGKWTKTFASGISTFSLPLEPIETMSRNADFYVSHMNASYIKWMDPITHVWIIHGEGEENDAQLELGRGYVVCFNSTTNYTFCGLPAAMINYDDDSGFSGFDHLTEAKSLNLFVDPDGDVILVWDEPGSMSDGWYEVYYSNTRDGFFGELNTTYFMLDSPLDFGFNSAFHTGACANDPGARLYYMVVPFNERGIKGASTYSVGVWTEEYWEGYDTFGLPLKLKSSYCADWFCDNIDYTLGINYYNVTYQEWWWHSTRMPAWAFDPNLEMTEGYQISTSNVTKFTFIGM